MAPASRKAKTVSLRSLADCILTGQLDLDRMHDLPDNDVVAQLDVVKGIGTWTADLFLMFHLHRPDVLPVGDLPFAAAYGLDGPPGPADLQRIAEPWRPYRSLACRYLWEMTHARPQV